MIKFLTCFTSYLLDCNLLVTLYLSFYHLIYLESLICFVQVFQAIGVYVPSATQILDLGMNEFAIILKLTFKSCDLQLCFMMALFHDKKCCNCFNFVPYILWDFIILGLVSSW